MWGASLTSNLADGLLSVAAPLLAIGLTKDPVLISMLSALVMLPWLFFAIPIGAVVDRVDRRYLLAGANATRFVIGGLLTLSISFHIINIYLLFLAVFLIGICEVAADTTSQSLIPQILNKSQYEKGNSRLQISQTVVQGFVGAPISGFLYSAAIYLPFLANSLGFLVAAVLAGAIPVKFLQDIRGKNGSQTGVNFISEMRFGISYLYNNKGLLRCVVTTASMGLCYSMATSTIVLFIIKEMQVRPSLFGVVFVIPATGAIFGGLLAPKLSTKFGRSKVMATSIFLSSLILLLEGFSPNIYIFIALATIGSFTIANWNILLMSTYQSVIPTHLFGRIHGTRRTLVWGLMPIGSVLGGFIAQGGLRVPLLVGGTIATAISLHAMKFFLHFGESHDAAE